jgi:hypothetical protein
MKTGLCLVTLKKILQFTQAEKASVHTLQEGYMEDPTQAKHSNSAVYHEQKLTVEPRAHACKSFAIH